MSCATGTCRVKIRYGGDTENRNWKDDAYSQNLCTTGLYTMPLKPRSDPSCNC